jgi:hypothetical protein
MQKVLFVLSSAAILLTSALSFAQPQCFSKGQPITLNNSSVAAYEQQGVQGREVLISGQVTRILPEDDKGLRHEKFIINIGDTNVMIVHNLNLAAKVPVQPGDQVAVCGVLLFIGQGQPMVHWTHWDPSHRHEDGFIYYNGQTYGLRPSRQGTN